MSDELEVPTTAGVLVWDNQTGAPAYVSLSQYDQAIASGRYRDYEQTTVRTNRLGAEVGQDVDQARAQISGGESFVSGERAATERHTAERRAAFDTLEDEVVTFTEGVADALTLGIVHDRSEEGELRRDVNSTVAFAGQMTGVGLSLLTPGGVAAEGARAAGAASKVVRGAARAVRATPLGQVTRGSEYAGKALAKALLGEAKAAETGLRAAGRRAIEEGTSNALMGAAMATGHGAADALIENKPFAAEAIAAEAGTGLFIGAGLGAGAALFGRAASRVRQREFISKGSGLLDTASKESASAHQAVGGAVASWDKAVEQHRMALGALKAVDESGRLGANGKAFLGPRRDLIKAAESAGARLKKVDLAKALASDDPVAVNKALQALDDYGDAVARLDEAMPRGMALEELRARSADSFDPHAGKRHIDELPPRVEPPIEAEGGMPSERFIDDAAAPTDKTAPGGKRARPASTPEASPAPSGNALADALPPTDGTMPGRKRMAPEPLPHGPSVGQVDGVAQELPFHRPSALDGFAYDVQQTAGQLGGEAVSLREVYNAMGRRGRVPVDFDRFVELVGEAEVAGYLGTTGARTPVSHVGDVGEALLVNPEYVGRGQVPYRFGERFNRFEDRGRWGNDTIADRPAIPDSVSVDEYPTPVNGPQNTAVINRRKGKGRDTLIDDLPAGREVKDPTLREMAPPKDPTLVDAVPAGRMADDGKTLVDDVPAGSLDITEPVPGEDQGLLRGARMQEYLKKIEQQGPRLSPGERAAEQVRAAMDQFEALSGGALGSVQASEAAIAAGLKEAPRGPLSDRLAQLWGLRQLGKAAAEGAKSGGKLSRGSLLERMAKSGGSGGGRAAVRGGDVKGAVVAGIGGAIGGHLVGAALGMAGNLAGAVGKTRDMVLKAGDRLLRGRGSRMVAAVPLAAKYSYDGSEPTDDVVLRVQQLQEAIANPEALQARVRETIGPLNDLHPEIADAVVQDSLRKLTNLSVRAPMFVWNAMGEGRPAGQQALRRFREYEDATWNMEATLESVANGTITRAQADALREQHPEAHAALTEYLLSDPKALARAPRERRQVVHLITGLPMIASPDYITRQQATFAPPQQAAPTTGAGALKPPAGTPASSLIAPGN